MIAFVLANDDAAQAVRRAQEEAPEGNSALWLRLALKELTPK